MKAILAVDDNLGFGQAGGLPWLHIKEDMEHFARVTKGNKLIMGRKTHSTLPIKPREDRPFHVLSRRNHIDSTPHLVFKEYLPEDGILIGGASLFNHTRFIEKCSEVFLTRVKGVFKADTKIQQSTIDYLEAHFNKEMLQKSDMCTIWRYYK